MRKLKAKILITSLGFVIATTPFLYKHIINRHSPKGIKTTQNTAQNTLLPLHTAQNLETVQHIATHDATSLKTQPANTHTHIKINVTPTTQAATITPNKPHKSIANRKNTADTRKFTLTPLHTKLIQTKKLAGFTLYKLQIGQNLKAGQYYILNTSNYKYNEFVLELGNNTNHINIWATNKKPQTFTSLNGFSLYKGSATVVSARYNYISNIVYATAQYLIIQPTTTTKLSNIELWYYTAKPPTASNLQTAENNSNLANSANSTNSVSHINTVADYYTSYTRDMRSGLKVSSLHIIPRTQWGANPATWDTHHPNLPINDVRRLKYIPDANCRWMPEYIQPRRFIIHHTVTHNHPSDPYREVREVYLYHAYSRGWGDIGYNFLIDSQGRIFEGKIGGVGVKGYHAFEAGNDMAVGIGLIGNFTDHNPTTAQLVSLKKLLAEQANIFNIPLHYCGGNTLTEWLNTSCTVFGHRHIYVWNWDNNDWYKKPTACPGEYFVTHGRLAQVVAHAEDLRRSSFTSIKDAKTWATNLVNSISNRSKHYLEINFQNADTKTLQELSNYVPKYTGIWAIKLMKNKKAYVTLKSYNNGYCGVVVPPLNWHGYDDCGSHGCMYFPASGGIKERLITILTALKLNPYIDQIKLIEQPQWAWTSTTASVNSINTPNMLKNKACIKDIGD